MQFAKRTAFYQSGIRMHAITAPAAGIYSILISPIQKRCKYLSRARSDSDLLHAEKVRVGMRALAEIDLHAKFEENLKFERLVADLSSHFIDVPAYQLDRLIESAQRRICEFLGVAALPGGRITPNVSEGGTYCLCGNSRFSPSYGANVVTAP